MIRSTLCILTKQTMEPSTTAYFRETLFKDVGGCAASSTVSGKRKKDSNSDKFASSRRTTRRIRRAPAESAPLLGPGLGHGLVCQKRRWRKRAAQGGIGRDQTEPRVASRHGRCSLHDTVVQHVQDQLQSVRNAKLVEDGSQSILHKLLAATDLLRDLAISVSTYYSTNDAQFCGAQMFAHTSLNRIRTDV
jgi:hypothetical protein